jgi:enoyl-[acyl-carrier protein] reductase II
VTAAADTARPAPVRTRVTELLGIDYPIVQAPMGWIARAQLASAVSEAGALGIIETSSGELDAVRREIVAMRELTSRPFGVNIAQAFVRDPAIVEFVVEQGVQFVTTSAGDPTKYTAQLKAAGLTVFHVVPTLAAALKAVDAGVDGLVVEGGEGGGFKNPRDVSTMVLVPLVASKVDVPIIAAGGITDGASMAAAFALGAEAVQMGTRMVSAAESPVHHNWKQAIVDAAETDTVFLNRFSRPGLRALRTARTTELERQDNVDLSVFGRVADLYFGGDLEASIALTGQVAGRIEEVLGVREIIDRTITEFRARADALAAQAHTS